MLGGLRRQPPMSGLLQIQRRGRQTKKRHLRRLLLRHDRESNFRQSFHEGFSGRPCAFREAKQREHEEEVPAITKVFAVTPQHLVPTRGSWDAVDHHAESSSCLPAGEFGGNARVKFGLRRRQGQMAVKLFCTSAVCGKCGYLMFRSLLTLRDTGLGASN